MGGIRAPQRPFEVKRLVQTIAEKPIYVLKEVEVLKEVPCPKQAGELIEIKGRLAKEGETSARLRDKCTILTDDIIQVTNNHRVTLSKLEMAEKRLKSSDVGDFTALNALVQEEFPEVRTEIMEKLVLDKKLLIIYTLAALASGLGIGVLL